MDMTDNFTVQQLAKHLQVHENTIYEWLDQGTIFPHAFKIKHSKADEAWLVLVSWRCCDYASASPDRGMFYRRGE